MPAGAGVDPIRDDLLRQRRVRRVRLLQHRHDRRVQVSHRLMILGRRLLHPLAVAHQCVVVASGEVGRAGDVIERRGLNQRQAYPRQRLLHRDYDVGVALRVVVKGALIKRVIAAVVHAEHDRHHGRLVGEDVALEPHVNRPAAPAAHPVAAPAGVDKMDVEAREPGRHVVLHEGGVQALLGDAVAIKDDTVAVLQLERTGGDLRSCRAGKGQQGCSRCPEGEVMGKTRHDCLLMVR